MRPVELLALLVAGFGLIKLIVVFIKPASWGGVVRKTYGRPNVTVPVALVMAVIFLNILLSELTIVQIFGAVAFTMAMMMVGAASFGEEIVALSEKILQDRNVLKKSWLSTSIWALLFIWVICEIFA